MENEQQKMTHDAANDSVKKGIFISGAGKLGDYIMGILIAVVAGDILGYVSAIYFSVDNLGYFDITTINREFGYGLAFNAIHWGGLAWVSLFAFFGLFLKTRWKYVIRGMFLPFLIGIICFVLLFGWCWLSYSGLF